MDLLQTLYDTTARHRLGATERWQAARYGEFRVDGSGRALLVGLRGADLQPL